MMKITVIYDNNDKSITYKSVQFILNKIKLCNINTTVNEFFIPSEFNSCALDCYSSCQYYCPYENQYKSCYYLKLIEKLSFTLNNSDLIILASSSSRHNITPAMYKILENLSYKWLPHKHNNLMTNKIALAISNTSSVTTFSYANMTLSRILRFWGINNDSIFTKSLSKYNSNNLPEKKYKKLNLALTKLSLKIVNKYKKTSTLIIPDFNKNMSCVKNSN